VEVIDGPDLEARCRVARMEVLPPGCLTGHTADDQAETVLFRLLRGTGPAGLAAMDVPRHPLLELRRSDTEELCEYLEVTPFVDPTNESLRFTRNRIRHEVLPLLSEVTGRDVVPLVNRTAELLRHQNAVIGELAAELDPSDVSALRSVPVPVAMESLRVWWFSETGGLPPPGWAAMQRMLDVIQGAHRGCEVTAGWRMDRSAGRLCLTKRSEDRT
jgi:tRNA(Ile)-lysidine synthase